MHCSMDTPALPASGTQTSVCVYTVWMLWIETSDRILLKGSVNFRDTQGYVSRSLMPSSRVRRRDQINGDPMNPYGSYKRYLVWIRVTGTQTWSDVSKWWLNYSRDLVKMWKWDHIVGQVQRQSGGRYIMDGLTETRPLERYFFRWTHLQPHSSDDHVPTVASDSSSWLEQEWNHMWSSVVEATKGWRIVHYEVLLSWCRLAVNSSQSDHSALSYQKHFH